MLPLQTLEPARNGVILRHAGQKARGQTSPRDDVCSWDDPKVASWIALVQNSAVNSRILRCKFSEPTHKGQHTRDRLVLWPRSTEVAFEEENHSCYPHLLSVIHRKILPSDSNQVFRGSQALHPPFFSSKHDSKNYRQHKMDTTTCGFLPWNDSDAKGLALTRMVPA